MSRFTIKPRGEFVPEDWDHVKVGSETNNFIDLFKKKPEK